jgi:hypothetical protein
MQRWSAAAFMAIALVLSLTGVAGMILATRNERIGSERSAVGIVEGIWFTFAHFSLDRWPGDLEGYLWLPTFAWFLPWAVLTLWGVALLCRDARAGRISASAIVALLIAPVGLFAIVHTLVPVYEARYAAPAFPAWLVALVYPILAQRDGEDSAPMSSRRMLPDALAPVLLVLSLTTGVATLVQPGKGLFSGDPVKEQWREAVTALALRVHPDDLVLLHPHYVEPMYAYYAPRVTPDPLPQPRTFPVFAEGDVCGIVNPTRQQMLECIRRRFEPFFNEQATGKKTRLAADRAGSCPNGRSAPVAN